MARNRIHSSHIKPQKSKHFSTTKNKKNLKNYILENKFPETSFFQQDNSPISQIQRRIYGLLPHNENIEKIRNNNEHNDRQNEYISKIIHKTKMLSNILAYASHNGKNWHRDGIQKMQGSLLNQLQGGRAMETILTEAMMNTKSKNGDGIDFLPAKELDLSYKTDMMTRLPYKKGNALKTFGFGTQITMAGIGDEKYQKKYNQIKAFIPSIEDSLTQEEIIERYGRIYSTDIMSYVAINGSIRKYMSQESNPALMHFRKWRKNNFDTDGLLPYFPKDFQQTMKIIAESIFEMQKYIMSEDFIIASGKSFHHTENINKNFYKNISYNAETRELTLEIYNQNEQLMKATFWITDKSFGKIFDINYPS